VDREDRLRLALHATRLAALGGGLPADEAGGGRVEDLVWYYPEPIAASEKIRDHLCFFNEKVDLEVDGEPQERPQTQWS